MIRANKKTRVLTDTGEDSKLVHSFLLFFFRRVRATIMTQRRVGNTRVHFWTSSPVSVQNFRQHLTGPSYLFISDWEVFFINIWYHDIICKLIRTVESISEIYQKHNPSFPIFLDCYRFFNKFRTFYHWKKNFKLLET